GALFEFLRGLGRPMADCGRRTPLQLLLEAGVLDERWIVAHLNELTRADLRRLESAPRFHIAHCPRSHAYFAHKPFALTELRQFGFNICLGTDSLASNNDLSLFAEMRQLSKVEPGLAPEELLEMATINPARALGQHGTLGRIAPGYSADFIAIPAERSGNALLEEVLEFDGAVPWMMIAGEKVPAV
ncbi:MAG TPA: amidohydrolase family protein, partial [Chthoniobacterales bacterium]|nr:amidohydrolase family protein [Chthoniobacterales bacterium]